MTIQPFDTPLTVCKVADYSQVDLAAPLTFTGKTDQENSLVCPTSHVPANTTEREDGWRAFRIQGPLDFSLVGILAQIAALLTQAGISLFALSTFDTDYILTKADSFDRALAVLAAGGCHILN